MAAKRFTRFEDALTIAFLCEFRLVQLETYSRNLQLPTLIPEDVLEQPTPTPPALFFHLPLQLPLSPYLPRICITGIFKIFFCSPRSHCIGAEATIFPSLVAFPPLTIP